MSTPGTRIELPSVAQIERYGISGPRFTSYPTALSFSSKVGDDEFRAAVADSNDRLIPAPLVLYLHIPFCRTLCYYCGCHKKVTRNASAVDRYLSAVKHEIQRKAALVDRDRYVAGIHWGGGTPTFLDAAQRRSLMAALSDNFAWAGDDDRDFSIEIDPRTVVEEDLGQLREIGFNRASFGVQDFDPQVQRAINRVQPEEITSALVRGARNAGFRTISIDLIYGLPHQTRVSFARTLDKVIELRPDALSVFNYAHLPERFPAQRLIKRDDLPCAKTRIELFRESVLRLQDAGYEYIGMDHFALPGSDLATARREGRLKRSFQGYTAGDATETLAFGASAISQIGDGYFQVRKSMPDYLDAINRGSVAIERGYVTTAEDRRVGNVIQEIMCYGTCDKRDWEQRYDEAFPDYFAADLERLQPLADDGLVVDSTERIEVTPLGWSFLRTVAGCFDRTRHCGQPVAADSAYSRAV